MLETQLRKNIRISEYKMKEIHQKYFYINKYLKVLVISGDTFQKILL